MVSVRPFTLKTPDVMLMNTESSNWLLPARIKVPPLMSTSGVTLLLTLSPTIALVPGVLLRRRTPAETVVRPEKVFATVPSSSSVPAPALVRPPVPLTPPLTVSRLVLLFVQVWFAPRMMPAAPVVFKGLRMNRVLPVTLLFTRMPVPEPMSVVADALIVTDITLLLLVLF